MNESFCRNFFSSSNSIASWSVETDVRNLFLFVTNTADVLAAHFVCLFAAKSVSHRNNVFEIDNAISNQCINRDIELFLGEVNDLLKRIPSDVFIWSIHCFLKRNHEIRKRL